MNNSKEPWIESVEEHKETLEILARRDYPLSDDFRQLLVEYRKETGNDCSIDDETGGIQW